MKILGIDPGTRIVGYGVIDTAGPKETLLDAGVIRLDGESPIPSRLVELEREITELFQEHKPDICAIEQLYSNYKHPRTAILMGHARGVILLVAQKHGASIRELAANRVKQSLTGRGHAKKQGMQEAIQAYWRLPELPSPPDVADALAIALCAARERVL